MQANKMIIVHNHPSGDPTPSKKDIEFTKRLLEASEIVGIKLLDHIVIGYDKYESIFSRGYIKVKEWFVLREEWYKKWDC